MFFHRVQGLIIMTIKYHYTDPLAAGRATIAYVDEEHEDGSITFYAGISYCGPKDVFRKHYGRDKSRGRLVQMTSSRDGWRLADRDPSKYLFVHVDKENRQPTSLQDFVEMADGVAVLFRPADVIKHYGP
jgi:hypothetical protein